MNAQITKDTKEPAYRKVVGAPTLEGFPDALTDPSANCSDDEKKAIADLNKQYTKEGCNSCHTNRGRNLYDFSNYEHIMNKYVAGGLMPKTNKSSPETRKAALACFENAAAMKVENWLKEGAECK